MDPDFLRIPPPDPDLDVSSSARDIEAAVSVELSLLLAEFSSELLVPFVASIEVLLFFTLPFFVTVLAEEEFVFGNINI